MAEPGAVLFKSGGRFGLAPLGIKKKGKVIFRFLVAKEAPGFFFFLKTETLGGFFSPWLLLVGGNRLRNARLLNGCLCK